MTLSQHSAALSKEAAIRCAASTASNALAGIDGTLDPSMVVSRKVLSEGSAWALTLTLIVNSRLTGRGKHPNRGTALRRHARGHWRPRRSDLVEVEAGHVFWVRSANDFFRKLHREKRRFESAESGKASMSDQVDAAINFAITAWHMTDWVWVQYEDKLREHFQVSCSREFQNEVRRRCPGLAVCDVIANAAKHGGVARPRKDRPDIETVLVAHPVGEDAGGAEIVAVLVKSRWSLIIEVDGIPHEPRGLFNRIFLFWHQFIQEHCIDKQPT